MEWGPNLPAYHQYYFDKDGNRKNYGIYCQVFDRWLIIDQYDLWTTLQTARVLSSKIASMVYVLPASIGKVTNNNCLHFMLFDKTRQKKGGVADLIAGQLPMVRIIDNPLQLDYQGLPEDYKYGEAAEMLAKIKAYADYTHKSMYAASVCNVAANFHDNNTVAQEFLPKEWLDTVSSYADRSDFTSGITQEIKKILYFSQTLEEAKSKIDAIWGDNYQKVWWMADYYYTLIDEKHNFTINGPV